MPHRLLFVCAMNVCRSPLMARTFDEMLPWELRGAWAVSSAGLTPATGHPLCPIVARLLDDDGEGHRPVGVDEDSLAASDLILTASRQERHLLAQRAPTLRERTFTFREALLLGEGVVATQERGLPTDPPLRRYAAALRSRRGIVAPAPARRRLPWGRPAADPFDVPDVHTGSTHAHRDELDRVHEEVVELVTRLRAFVGEGEVR